ncbi:hypothetical protein SGLAM104S_07756 [Streptomyces glaucescens]
MVFTTQERCFSDNAFKVACSDGNFDSKQSHLTRPWFDTPADLACKAGKKCTNYAPLLVPPAAVQGHRLRPA